jgi:hypothetical protein
MTTAAQPEPTRAELEERTWTALNQAAQAWWEVRGAEGVPALKRTKKKAWDDLAAFGEACRALGRLEGREEAREAAGTYSGVGSEDGDE